MSGVQVEKVEVSKTPELGNWDEAKAFGAAIKRELLERGWSKAELSRRTGINATTIGQIIQGRFIPYLVQVEKIEKALGVEFLIERYK